MSENVISLGSRKPFQQVQEEAAANLAAVEQSKTEAQLEAVGRTLDAIDKLRDFVASGRCGGLVFISQETATGLFLSDVILPKVVVPTQQLFGWAGMLSGLSMELGEYATMSPQLLMDGTVSDPDAQQAEEFGEDE